MSPATSVANRDISLAIALNIAGINLVVAGLASREHTTTMSKRNPYRWQERWPTLATHNKKLKIGLTGSLEKVMR